MRPNISENPGILQKKDEKCHKALAHFLTEKYRYSWKINLGWDLHLHYTHVGQPMGRASSCF